MLFIAALKTVPPSPLGVGEVDGVNRWHRLVRFKLPIISSATGTTLSMMLAVVALGIGFLVVRATGRSVQK